jgi:hypothetical protein
MSASSLEKLGDPEEVAAKLRELSGEPVTRHSMRNWPARGYPKYIRPFVARLFEKAGINLPKELRRYAADSFPHKADR